MSTSTKTKASIRQGGPGSSHQNADQPLHISKPPADDPMRRHSHVSGGGGEHDSHHRHDAADKGGRNHTTSEREG
jgi:hypothetical protein